jgi:pantoate--beta-alanine ligase
MQEAANELRRADKTIGVVPTMGFLHEGHVSLMNIARQKADILITTIFVNPAQFGPNEDFTKYPRDIERDKRLAESAGTDYLFIPENNEIYPENYLTYVEIEKITDVLEGKFRPSHFRGVATVVAKLFNITKPHIAVFGQKDAQQAAVIKKMVKDLNFDLEIIIAPIVREPDGLAMSSRNVYLSERERQESLVLFHSLLLGEELVVKGERDCDVIRSEMRKCISAAPSAAIDYVSIADSKTLDELSRLKSSDIALFSLAVRIGTTRLIDNITVSVR